MPGTLLVCLMFAHVLHVAYEVPDDAMQQQTLQGVHNVLTQQQVPQQQLAHVQITQQQESAAAQVQGTQRPGPLPGQ